ncbi:MAG: HD domain-containing protein [Deltaproteobacteria bacterium]|nr:HD domain-containing protein [Deltaproteobacteria bacterium]
MEIRDVIHGTIEVTDAETFVIDSPFFQRLRNIKQLGFGENSFPGATHNRYIHSLGALHLASVAFDNVFSGADGLIARRPKDAARLRAAVRMAAMLHDVGHGPLSHTTEFAMPLVERLGLQKLACVPGRTCAFTEPRQANHEDYTLKIILQSSMTDVLKRVFRPFGVEPLHIAAIISDAIYCPEDFFTVDGIDYRPILHQFVSSEIDVDRMDYLRRDSFHAGVSYGKFDADWLLSNLSHHLDGGKCYLALKHRALYTFDDFLISRFHMFLMVYFHHKCVVYDELLGRYFRSSDCDYAIPSDIEKYIYFDDYHLYTHLARSRNDWAQRVYHKRPYKMLVEFHSGIPLGAENAAEQKRLRDKAVAELREKGVDFIEKTTTGELSKYFRAGSANDGRLPIYVRYDNGYSPVKFIPLEECTDLFARYPENRSITRIYVP